MFAHDIFFFESRKYNRAVKATTRLRVGVAGLRWGGVGFPSHLTSLDRVTRRDTLKTLLMMFLPAQVRTEHRK